MPYIGHQCGAISLIQRKHSPSLRAAALSTGSANSVAEAGSFVQQQQGAKPAGAAAHSTSWYTAHWDLSLWSYLPWWLQPAPILGSGLLFFVLALVLDNQNPPLKAAVIAGGPLALYYALALVVLPSQFKRVAISYLRRHPELDGAAAAGPRASVDDNII